MHLNRSETFCRRFGLRVPILLAPMAGACPPGLSIAVAQAGGLGACGALLMQPAEITQWAATFRAATNGALQMNLWIPDPPPVRDSAHEARVRNFLGDWGPEVPEEAADAATVPDFAAQCEALLTAGPAIISSIMGVYPADFVAKLKQRGIAWFATVTTVAEARAAEAAGADVIVAQGAEAGGHRGAFNAADAERHAIGLFALLPAVVDAVSVPVVATGGIGDARGVAAALMLGASAAQIGSALLRCPESGIHPALAEALARIAPEDTILTRAFSGRTGRSVATAYVKAANGSEAPIPAPYPIQRALTGAMRATAQKANDLDRMQAWAGQGTALGKSQPAAEVVRALWEQAKTLLGANWPL
jgi:nitronate monooxygenase